MKKILALFVVVVLCAITSRLSFFTVEEARSALVVGWDNTPVRVIASPGLHAKLPDPLQRVVYADMRRQALSVPAADAKGLAVAYDVLWRIHDPRAWWAAFSGSPERTVREIADTVRRVSESETAALADASLMRRGEFWIAQRVRQSADKELGAKGIGLEDLRVSEIHLPEDAEKAALAATGEVWKSEVQDSGRLNKANAEALLQSADREGQREIERAFADAAAAVARADAEADARYRDMEAVTGAGGFARRVHDARAQSRQKGSPEPFDGAQKGGRP